MKKSILMATVFWGSISVYAESAVYKGTSPLDLNGSNNCEVEISIDNQKQISAIATRGPAEKWEILAEKTSGGYGPDTNISQDDSELKDANFFKKLGFIRSSNLFSSGFALESTVSDIPPMNASYVLQFELDSNKKLRSLKKTFKAKKFLVTLASSEFICEDLHRVK